METLLALALGFLVGLGVGALRGFRMARSRRAASGATAGFARLWPDKLPSRSAADMLQGVVRIYLGGQVYILPVLPRAPARRWLESLNARFAGLVANLGDAGDDTPRILELLAAQADDLYALLQTYDVSGVLPPREAVDETATDTEILRATMEVWRAANPLADLLASRSEESRTPGTEPELPSSSPPPMDGVPTTSRAS